ncbi:MAG: hypothetical protein UU09_C0037G0022 [Microgenomates group bacterium GW2011_GWA2_40_6]|nr:MAG: hypothetical protein UU09_C0037G0022 [Microgenomates group bacterium GW2011_GWA2_40_6]
MKNKSLSVIFSIIMIGALIGGLVLVKENQETRRGAYFAGTKVFMMPEEHFGQVGNEVIAQLFVETENEAKLSSIDTQICYGNELTISEDDPSSQIELNKEALGTLVDASIVGEGYKCLRLVAIADLNKKPEDLKGGMVRVATIKFVAINPGEGEIKIDREKTKVGGYNPTAGATDSALKVGEIGDSRYDIKNELVEPTVTLTPTEAPIGEDSILNYKVAFANVNGNDAKCVVNWPLQFIVLGGGTSRVYSGIIPQSKEVVGGKLVFSGSLVLTGFQRRVGVAVFAKGPKHLQVKYGKNNQEGPYNQAGGEIVLTANADTSPVYDFSKYPIIAGDVVGVSSETPDGWINGVDFSFVKSKSLVHETVNEGGYLKGDLDGNCQVNSNDVNILKISLQAKQGELY